MEKNIEDVIHAKQTKNQTIENKRLIHYNILFKNYLIYHKTPITFEALLRGKEDFSEHFATNWRVYKTAFNKKCKPKIAYLITLTSNKGVTEDDFKTAFTKIKHYKKFKIYYIYGVIEYTQAGLPHVHIYCEANDYIRLDRLKVIWKKSSIDIRRAFNRDGVDKYLDKDPRHIRLE